MNLPPDRQWGPGPSWLQAWLLVAIAAIGFLVATPPSAGADEPTHMATAWYVTGHGLPPATNTAVGHAPVPPFELPASLVVYPCFAHRPATTASCLTQTPAGMTTTVLLTNYPPPYYWVVGLGERLGAAVSDVQAGVGGRLASTALDLLVLLLVAWHLQRRRPGWGALLLLVATPSLVFFSAVVNPSGFEAVAAIALAAALAEVGWVGDDEARPTLGVRSAASVALAAVALAALALALARPIGFVWVVGLALTALALAPRPSRALAGRLGLAILPSVIVGVGWAATHPTTVGHPSADYVLPVESVGALWHWFVGTVVRVPTRLHQAFGDLGWLDTPMPDLVFTTLLVGWAALLARLPGIRTIVGAIGLLWLVIVPGLIEAAGWRDWPHWWQGRYTLPMLAGFAFLLLLRSGERIPRTVTFVSGLAVASLGFMVWYNAARYAWGLRILIPGPHAVSATSPVALGVALFAAILLVAVGFRQVVLVRSVPPDA